METAKDGREALAFLCKSSFGIAVLDLYMPKLNGLEVLQAIHLAGIQLHPILMTGYPTKDGSLRKAVQAMKTGAVDFLKPFEVSNLVASIHRLLQHHPSPHVLAERLEAYVEHHACNSALKFSGLLDHFGISGRYGHRLFSRLYWQHFQEMSVLS